MKRIENHVRHTENLLNAIKIAMADPTCNLNSWIQPCGTLGCVLGTYILNYHKKLVEHLGDLQKLSNRQLFRDVCLRFDFEKEFGFTQFYDSNTSPRLSNDVVGDQYQGSLESRYDYVNEQLEILKSKVA